MVHSSFQFATNMSKRKSWIVIGKGNYLRFPRERNNKFVVTFQANRGLVKNLRTMRILACRKELIASGLDLYRTEVRGRVVKKWGKNDETICRLGVCYSGW